MAGKYIDFDAALSEADEQPVVVRYLGRDWELFSSLPAKPVMKLLRLRAEGRGEDELEQSEMVAFMTEMVPGGRARSVARRRAHDQSDGAAAQGDRRRLPGRGRRARGRAGGSAGPRSGACAFLEHWTAVEADFAREYQMDVLAEVRAGMSWRRFNALLSGLSPHAVYRLVQRQAGRAQRISGADAPSFFASFPRAGD